MVIRKLWVLTLKLGLVLGSAGVMKSSAFAAPAARPAARRPAAKSKAPPPRPGSVRSVLYTEAYQKSPQMGQHLAIKITPPGARGKPGFILVEAYNYSHVALRAVDLRISMQTAAGEELDANISANHVRPGLSGLTALKLPDPNRPVKVVHAKIKKMVIFDNRGKRISLNYYIDIIR